jgi:hypothetical protein
MATRNRIIAAFAVLAIGLGIGVGIGTGINESSTSKYKASMPPVLEVQSAVCRPAGVSGVVAHMGECVQHHFNFTTSFVYNHVQGLDISLYQEIPDWRTVREQGTLFVWNQAFDGGSNDWNFYENWKLEREHGITPGGYAFLRPGCGFCQGARLGEDIRRAGRAGGELPPLLDAEVPGAYEIVSEAADGVRSVLGANTLVATYTSPGLWEGCCRDHTALDAAVWFQPAYAFGGWPTWIAQQFCGFHCYLSGINGEVDLQSDHGVLALIHPCNEACQRHELAIRLHRLERQVKAIRHDINVTRVRIRMLHNLLIVHHCRRVHGRHAYRGCKKLAVEGRVAHRHGDGLHKAGNRIVAEIHAIQSKGIY